MTEPSKNINSEEVSDVASGATPTSVYDLSGMKMGDMNVIIKFFELECANYAEEDYAIAHHYRDVYSTENFSLRVQEQMAYYPGIHSASPGGVSVTGQDPFQTHAQQLGDQTLNYWANALRTPESFMSGLKTREADLDYTTMFEGDAKDVASNIASSVTECIPCFDRIFDGAQLLPDGNLLEIHLLNIKLRFDLLDQLKNLFKGVGLNINICELLNMFSHLCPRDLLALLALFSQYLAKLNLDFSFNLDLLIELIGPILSPFLDSLTEWLDKWVQMIIAPIICVIDNINATIYIAQQFKIPFSEASVGLDFNAGVSAPNILDHIGGFSQAQSSSGIGANAANDTFYGYTNNEAFNSPSADKYISPIPEIPEEEIQLALAQIKDDFNAEPDPDNYYENLTIEERQKLWDQIKADYWQQNTVNLSESLYSPTPHDGSQWTPNNTPLSESQQWNAGFNGTYDTTSHPPEDQSRPKDGTDYYLDAGPLVDPIIQMRNIAVAGIRYVQDWFEWATQLIYDLLGTEFGWMKKKMGNTMLKTNLIQLIAMIRAILQAAAQNGLECGVDTNFDSDQLRFILEDVMGKISPYKFKARPNGTFEMILPNTASNSAGQAESAAGIDQPSAEAAQSQTSNNLSSTTSSVILDPSQNEQSALKSGKIIKDCLKRVRSSEVDKVREWIADFERRSNGG